MVQYRVGRGSDRPGGPARRGLTRGKAAGVTHVRPRGRLDVGQQLSQVVPVVVNPLVQEIAHPEMADLRVEASAREIAGLEPGNEGAAVPAERVELGGERLARALAVAPGPG